MKSNVTGNRIQKPTIKKVVDTIMAVHIKGIIIKTNIMVITNIILCHNLFYLL